MGKMTLIVGGARSGKSNHALQLAGKYKDKVAFVATCRPLDKEMKERIKLHKMSRPSSWKTFEEAENIDTLLEKIGNTFEYIIIDCLTLLVSNLMFKKYTPQKIEDKIKRLITGLKKNKARAILVSNEVGLGIVPGNKLARDFRDIAGKINQVVAQEAEEVIFMVSGVPVQIKNKEKLK